MSASYVRYLMPDSRCWSCRDKFEEKNGADVAGRAIFAAQARGGRDPVEFWVRVGNATKQLHGDDMAQYMADRWD